MTTLRPATERRRRLPRATWTALLIATLAALVPIAGHASAQQQQLTVQVAGLTASDASNAQGVISVLDNGRPLPDLTAQEFQAWINDTSVPVTNVSRAVDSTQSIAVVLALDTSGSMQEAGALDQAKDAARSFVAALAPQDSVAIVTFADTANVVLPFTQDRAAIEAAISGLSAQGTTALYQATVDSLHLAAESGNSRRAVVLLSDGGRGVLVGEGTGVRADALSSAESLGVPVFAIGLGPDIDRDYLTPLAQVSGGQFAETPSADGLAQLYQNVGEQLRGQYILSLDASGVDLPAGDVATLRVAVQAGESLGSDSREVCLQPICVALNNLAQNERISDARTVAARVVSAEPIASVVFLVDGKPVATVSSPPYQFTLDPASVAKGSHTLAAQATTAAGATQTREISLRTGPASGGISSTMLLLPVVGIAIALVAFFALRIIRRRRPRPREVDLSSATLKALAATPRVPSQPVTQAKLGRGLWIVDEDAAPPSPGLEEALGRLSVTAGPLAGQTFPVQNQPVSIGSSSRCLIQLPDEGLDPHDVKPEQARVWVRDSHLMVHELRRLTELGPAGGRWEILSPGDQFVVGACTFKFELVGEPAQVEPVRNVPEPVKQPQSVEHPLRAIMTPVIPETPLEALTPEPKRTWAARDVAEETPQAKAGAVEPGGAAPRDVAPPPPSEETVPIAELSPEPAASPPEAEGDEQQREPQADGEEVWNAPIPFRRPERPAIGGPLGDSGDPVPDILRDRMPQAEEAARDELPLEEGVPNILRDRPTGTQAGPFADAESTAPPSDAVPNILRDPNVAEGSGHLPSNPDVTDPQSWSPL